MKYILAMDQGTTSSRSVLFNIKGEVTDLEQVEYPIFYPQPGWVEQKPEDILWSQLQTAKTIIARNGLTEDNLISIGITNQRETTILWDRATGEPVYNAVVWQCRRSSRYCEEYKRLGLEDTIHHKTGLYLDAYFSATKIKWILDNVQGLRARCEKGEIAFGTVDSWLIYNLTGKHVTDYTNASRTLLFNIETLSWDKDLLELFGIPEAILPGIEPSDGDFGRTRREVLGLEVPITGVAGDQQAALFGQTCFDRGEVKNTYGTGCFMLMNTKDRIISGNGLITTVGFAVKNKVDYCFEGSVFTGGAVIKWLRDNLKLISSAAESESIACSVEDTEGVYIVPAFSGLGAPYWDMYARGIIVGLTGKARREHIVRAALEAIAYQVKDVLDAMEKEGGSINLLKIDGGASANDFLLQFQSDMLDKKIVRPRVLETTALGAALISGLGAGAYKDLDELKKLYSIDRIFSSIISGERRQKLYAGWQRAVERAKLWETE